MIKITAQVEMTCDLCSDGIPNRRFNEMVLKSETDLISERMPEYPARSEARSQGWRTLYVGVVELDACPICVGKLPEIFDRDDGYGE